MLHIGQSNGFDLKNKNHKHSGKCLALVFFLSGWQKLQCGFSQPPNVEACASGICPWPACLPSVHLPSSFHLFANDLQLYCSFKSSEAHKLISLFSCLSNVRQRLSDISLHLKTEKTETHIVAPEGAMNSIKQHLGNPSSSVKSKIRNLGVCFDESMSLKNHSKQPVKNYSF